MTEWTDVDEDDGGVYFGDDPDDIFLNRDLFFDGPLIRRVSVTGLFGRYNYELELPDASGSRLLLLYGENGAGKTNILRLIWHVLSPADNRGHRQALASIPFRAVSVALADGSIVRVSRQRATTGPYQIGIEGTVRIAPTEWPGKSSLDDWGIEELRSRMKQFPRELRPEARKAIGQKSYLEYLKNTGANPLFLADDRNIYSDDFESPGGRRERDESLRRAAQVNLQRNQLPDDTQSLVAREAVSAIKRANEYLRSLTLGATTSGSASANSVYLEVLDRLSSAGHQSSHDPTTARTSLERQLIDVGARSQAFEALGLIPALAPTEFLASVAKLDSTGLTIAQEVIGPYLSSLNARLDALQEAQQLIQVFLDELNGFLSDKHVQFSPNGGLRIYADGPGEVRLMPQQLSSGERQLMLLLCNALLAARQGSRLFLIDEPELSLNVKWQRRIGDALLAVSRGMPLQFIVATHSIELLSKFRPHVLRLEPQLYVD